MKTLLLFGIALALGLGLLGCGTSAGSASATKTKKKQGAHIRVVNATDHTLTFILYPNKLNEQNRPGEANFFQKEPPGKRKLQILGSDQRLLQELEVEVESGRTSTFVVMGGPKSFDVQRFDDEARFGDKQNCKVVLASAVTGSGTNVEATGPTGTSELGSPAGPGIVSTVSLSPGEYEFRVGGHGLGKKKLEPGLAYSVFLRQEKGKPALSILRNSPPDLIVVGFEKGSSAN